MAPEIKNLKLESLHVEPFHHRTIWGDMPALRDSIAAEGVLSPLLVRPRPRSAGGYGIVFGVRRHKGAEMAGLKTVPCMVEEMSDEDAIVRQVDENRQRADLHMLDEALYCGELTKQGMQADAIAKRLGLKKRDVHRRMALLALGDAARKAFGNGRFDDEAAFSLAQVGDVARQRDVLAALDAGTLQPEEISSYIRRTFTAPLDDVPWRKSDEKLLPKAGACNTCPKRSDVQRDLFPDASQGLRCLDVDCYRSKMSATWDLEIAKPGVALFDQPTESVFAPSSSGRPTVMRSSGMVDVNAMCPHLGDYTWEAAVGKIIQPGSEPPQLYLARDQDGRPRYIYRESVVSKIVKKSEIGKSAAEARAALDPHRAGDAAAAGDAATPATSPRTEGKIRRKLIAAIADRVIRDDHDTWTWVVAQLLEQLTPRAVSAAVELLGPMIRQLDPPAQDGAPGLVQLAGESARQARRVATAALIFEVADVVGEVVKPIRELAELCGVDIAALEAEVRK